MKERDSNIELFRCAVMFLIVAHHYLMHSGLLQITVRDLTSPYSVFLYMFGMWGKVGIDCFVLITGYYMCKSVITIKKYVKLLLEVEFYKVAFFLLFYNQAYHEQSLGDLLIYFLPFKDLTDNFVDCYLIFYLFIPFLNIFVNSLTKHQHRCVVFLCLFVFCIWPQLHFFKVQFNYVVWFIVIYLVGSYIRIYRVDKNNSARFWGIISLVFIFLACSSVYLLLYAGKPWPYFFVYDSNSIFAVLISVSVFLFFKNLCLKNMKCINTIGASTFGILLIHDASWEMRHWLWNDLFRCKNWYGDMIYLHAILVVSLVFIVCSLVDQLRTRFFEQPLMKHFFK